MKGWKTAGVFLTTAGALMAWSAAGAQAPDKAGTDSPPARVRAFEVSNGQFWNKPNIVQQLNLTDEQRKTMDGILQDHRMKLIDLRADLQKNELLLEPMLKADTPDRKTIEAQIDKIVSARAALEKANSLFLLDVRMQLTPQQWKQLQTLHARQMERMHEHMRDDRGWGQGDSMHGMGGHLQGPPPDQPGAAPPQPGSGPAPGPAPAPTPDSSSQQ